MTAAACASWRVHVLRVHHKEIAGRLLLPQDGVELSLRRQGNTRRPPGLQRVGGLDGLPLALSNDPHEVVPDHDLEHPRHRAYRGLVDVHQCGPDRRWSHDAAMHHAGHAHVVHVCELPRRHGCHVETGHGLAEHRPRARGLLRGAVVLSVMWNGWPATSSP